MDSVLGGIVGTLLPQTDRGLGRQDPVQEALGSLPILPGRFIQDRLFLRGGRFSAVSGETGIETSNCSPIARSAEIYSPGAISRVSMSASQSSVSSTTLSLARVSSK